MPDTPPAPGRRTWLLGAALLAAAATASLSLALRHLGAGALPGCGLDSPCGRALASPWATLPGLDWPVAFLGASHFLALGAAWLRARGAWPAGLRVVARLTGLVSLALLGALLALGEPCPYCLGAHAANLVFLLACERRARPAPARRTVLLYLGLFLATSAALAGARGARRDADRERAEAELARSTAALRDPGAEGRDAGFTGRQRLGPERAPIRLVLFTDYQCPDCARMEAEAQDLVRRRGDVSLSVKHFPLCKDCNSLAREKNQNPHPNACWAARAAEAAGMVAGAEGFWRMHAWLFARGGGFVDRELAEALPALELPPGPFLEAMNGLETLARVQADVAEGLGLGLANTPVVFVNGVELRGWRAPAALTRAVEALAATRPAAADAQADRPPAALEKALADWRLEPVLLPAAGAELELVLWSDYLDAPTRELDRALRAFAAAHERVRYSFRHYPLDPSCVSGAPNLHPGACRAAGAAVAARALGGEPAAAALHAWLIERGGRFDDAALAEALGAAGLEREPFLAALAAPETRAAVAADVAEAKRLGIGSIPFLFVGGKRVPRWRLAGEPLLERLLDEALAAPR